MGLWSLSFQLVWTVTGPLESVGVMGKGILLTGGGSASVGPWTMHGKGFWKAESFKFLVSIETCIVTKYMVISGENSMRY